jgi:hypothetical protein
MDFIASLIVSAEDDLESLAGQIGNALQVSFHRDSSGYYEEFPAFVADVLGIEIAFLGIPADEDIDEENPIDTYSLIVRTIIDAPDDAIEVDLSIHLQKLLHNANIKCTVGNA